MLYQQHVQFPLYTGEKAVFLVGHVIPSIIYMFLEFNQVFVEKFLFCFRTLILF